MKSVSEVRVRYGETDRMGYCHHANYPIYFEIARTDWLRKFKLSYKELEDSGVIMPVANIEIKYKTPALYDDVLEMVTYVMEPPKASVSFVTEVYRKSNNDHICTGIVTLAFQDTNLGKVMRVPGFFLELFKDKVW